MARIDVPPLNQIPELVIGRIDAVVRPGRAGRDASGAVVVAETTVYTDWPATLDLEPAGGDEAFGQPVMEYVGTFYVAPADDGSLPDIRKRDLLTAGAWPSGQPRIFTVSDVWNPWDNGTMLIVKGRARAPAA